MSTKDFRDRAAIVGVGYSRGQTPVFNRNSGKSVLTLAIWAALDACKDAGIDPRDLDGGCAFHLRSDSIGPRQVLHALSVRSINSALYLDGGGDNASSTAVVGAEAVIHGVSKYFLCYRAMNGRSGVRMGGQGGPQPSARVAGPAKWFAPFGLGGAPQTFGFAARRYMAKYGVTSEDFGRLAVNSRSHAVNNPRAVRREPITLEDHQTSRWVSEPFHLLDCCQETDVATAFIVTTVERARDLKKPPVLISAGMAGEGPPQEDIVDTGGAYMARMLLEEAGIELKDIDVAQPYDNFPDNPMRVMEDLGFCGKGEFKDWMKGGRIDFDGELPIITQGGLHSEGYAHGLNNLTELVMQLRGDAEDMCPQWQEGIHTYDRSMCRQVRDAKIGIHSSEDATSGVILRRG